MNGGYRGISSSGLAGLDAGAGLPATKKRCSQGIENGERVIFMTRYHASHFFESICEKRIIIEFSQTSLKK